jgi:hypothetical protein
MSTMGNKKRGPTFAELLKQPTWSETRREEGTRSSASRRTLDALMARPDDTVIEASRVESKRVFLKVAGIEYALDQSGVPWEDAVGHVEQGGVVWLAEGLGGWRLRAFVVRAADLPRLRSRYVQESRDRDDWGFTGSRWTSETGQSAYFVEVDC